MKSAIANPFSEDHLIEVLLYKCELIAKKNCRQHYLNECDRVDVVRDIFAGSLARARKWRPGKKTLEEFCYISAYFAFLDLMRRRHCDAMKYAVHRSSIRTKSGSVGCGFEALEMAGKLKHLSEDGLRICLPRPANQRWTPELIAKLGVKSDLTLALQFECMPKEVTEMRKALGIPARRNRYRSKNEDTP